MSSVVPLDVQQFIDSARVSATQKVALAICLALGIADGIAAVALGFALPSLAREWDRPVAGLTPVALIAAAAIAIGALTLSPMADRFGRRPMVIFGATVMGVFMLAAAAAPAVWVFAGALAIAGLGFGALPGTIYTYAAEVAPSRRRGLLVSTIGCGLTAGGVLCGVAAGLLIPAFGWRSLFVAAGIFPLIMALLAVKWLPETLPFLVTRGERGAILAVARKMDPAAPISAAAEFAVPANAASKKSPVRSLFENRRGGMTILFFVLYLCQYMAALLIFTWLPSLLIEAGVSDGIAVFASSAFPLGGVVGAIVLGVMMDRTRNKPRILPASFGVGAVAVAVSAYSLDATPVLVAALFVAGFGVAGTGVATNPVVAELYPAAIRSTAIGWGNGFGRVGSVIGPGVGGLLLGAGLSVQSIFLWSLAPVLLAMAAAFALVVVALEPNAEARVGGPIGNLPASVSTATAG